MTSFENGNLEDVDLGIKGDESGTGKSFGKDFMIGFFTSLFLADSLLTIEST
jgi:hypothetical protein